MELPAELVERMKGVRNQFASGQMERSKAEYALKRLPARYLDHPAVMSMAGRLNLMLGNSPVGLGQIQKAFSLDPDNPDIAGDMAKVLWAVKQQDQAIRLLDDHFRKFPLRTDIGGLLAYYLQLLGRADAAAAVSEQIVRAAPEAAGSRIVRANRLLELRDYDASVAEFEGVLAEIPGAWPIALGLFMAELYRGVEPLHLKARTESFCRSAFGSIRRRNPPVRRVSGRLRIGYIGATFRRHVVAHFSERLIAAHDRSRVSVTLYSDSAPDDTVTDRFRAGCDAWRPIKGLPDHEVVDQILRDEIDVLVDLGGHTESSCLPILAHRAAPVQVTYLGYPATTGLAEVDYKITDALADPPGMTESHYTERLWRLPRCAWAYAQFPEDERFDAHLPPPPGHGPLRLGAFNVLHKAEQRTVALWGRSLASLDPSTTLQAVDRRGLRLDESSRNRLLGEFAAAGMVSPERRIELLPPTDNALDRYKRYSRIDLNLDPLTYHGTTTTCEALWYGVPTLALAGRSHVSRVACSLLEAVGLGDQLVATDERDFESKLRRFAEDPGLLRSLRPTLRDRLKHSPLGDAVSLAQALEDAYFTMSEEQYRLRGG